jgi:hypothetical protein
MPRRPSARLKHKLFGNQAQTATGAGAGVHWLVPATALFLLACALWDQPSSVTQALHRHSPEVALVLSNQSAAPYVTAVYQRAHNRLADSFEWTNGSNSFSSIGSLSPGRGTN